jgi:hypothetical protein
VRIVLLAVVLCACKPGDSSPHKSEVPARAPPVDSKAIEQAHAELELVAPTDQHDACRQYDHSDFLANPTSPQAYDIGDFFGRLQTLFGPTTGHVYTLRHKTSGVVITISPATGLAYMAPRDSDDVAREARIAADPVVSAGPPSNLRDMDVYIQHAKRATAAPALTAAVTRLDALIERVPPADWELTDYFHDLGGVFHVGAAHGKAFDDPLPAPASLTLLLDRAEHTAPGTEADLHAIEFYIEHASELAMQRPRVVALYQRFASAAAQPGSGRDGMQEMAETWRKLLKL